jgi:hypothetical protein
MNICNWLDDSEHEFEMLSPTNTPNSVIFTFTEKKCIRKMVRNFFHSFKLINVNFGNWFFLLLYKYLECSQFCMLSHKAWNLSLFDIAE